jgi:hypothetical protein
MPVPLEDYHVREKGLVIYDTLVSIAQKYNTTPAAIKYFNRHRGTYDRIKDLSTGEEIDYAPAFNKIDPAEIPVLSVPQRVSGASRTNKQAGSVSTTRHASWVSKRIILKRINASYGAAVWDQIFTKTPAWEYINSAEVQPYHHWDPLASMLRDVLASSNSRLAATRYQQYTKYFAKVFRLEATDAGRANRLGVANTRNTSGTPDQDADRQKVLQIIEKINDLNAPDDSYGHWWLEIYWNDIDLPPATVNDTSRYTSVGPTSLRASYGFWPLAGAKLGGGAIIGSVPGGINRIKPPPPFDPTHPVHKYDPYADGETISWKVNKAFFVTDPYSRDEDTIYSDIIDYLNDYPADMQWAWPDTSEKEEHCQTFQKELLAACGLVAAPEIPRGRFPPLDKYKQFWGMETF